MLLLVLIGARFRCRLNVPFALFLLAFSLRLGSVPFWSPRGVALIPELLTLIGPVPLLFGPLVWWYVRNLVGSGHGIPRFAPAHALPWVVETIALSLYVYSLCTGEYAALVTRLFSDSPPWWMTVRHLGKILHGLIYAVLAARIAFGGESRSGVVERPRLLWARVVVVAPLISMLAFALVALRSAASGMFAAIVPAAPSVVITAGFSSHLLPAIVMMATIYGFAMVVLFFPNVLAVGTVGPSHGNGCSLDEDEIDEIAAAVRRALDSGAYRDPDLTVASLAEDLGVHPRRLSLVINHAFGRNFSQVVTGKRLYWFMERVSVGDLRERTILDLAFDAGFSSKSTFNRVFKERYGSAPSEYLRDGHGDADEAEGKRAGGTP